MAVSKTENPAASPKTGPGAMPGAQMLLTPQVSPTGPAHTHCQGLKTRFLLDR